VVAPPGIRPEVWARTLPAESAPLVLAPASARGWFGGTAIAVWRPDCLAEGLTLREAAVEMERCFSARTPAVAVALLPYDGPSVVARYGGGLVRNEDGWRVWGTLDAADVPPAVAAEPSGFPGDAPLALDVRSDLDGPAFRARVRAIHEAIRRGAFYVLNLTRRLVGDPAGPASTAFAALAGRARADMAAFWATPRVTLVSASPERFVRVAGDCVRVCPIKGTRPRADGARDGDMAAELRASTKERAEHIMIVDMERNDLGRVCRPGTVTVDPLCEVTATPYCHQMVSCVSGRLEERTPLGDVLAATFPCGSVTGAPKIAAMRAIAALETSPRSAYTGSLVVAVPGELDSSVLIRTAEYAEGVVRWGTGGGITADSDPAEEWMETLLKASPFLGDGMPRDALRETCRLVAGRIPLLPRHLARLAAGGCGPSALARARAAMGEAAAQGTAGHNRLSLTVEPSGAVAVQVSNAASSLDIPGGPRLLPVICAPPRLPAGAAKPACRAPWDEAQRRAREAGADQAVLVDARGRLIDGATASLWIRLGTRLLTPPAPPAVDGVGRGVVLDFADACGYAAHEADVTVAQLGQADEVFLSNALAGIVPVRGRAGPAARAVAEVFHALFGASCPVPGIR
jgi:para-aminobenzoate synthetase/4-amino-4-deoxychorismate lyase